MEEVCQHLSFKSIVWLRTDTNRLLNMKQPPKANITLQESMALKGIKRDKISIILTADKRVAMVVTHRQEYVKKAQEF